MPGKPAPHKPETLFEPRFLHPGIFLIIPFATLAAIAGLTLFKWVPPWVIIGIAVAIPSMIIGWWLYRLSKVRRTLQTFGRFLCLNCHYPLNGLPDEGVCPECRQPYQRAVTERRWLNWEEAINKGKPLA